MSKEIIYSFKEYQEKYNLLLNGFLLEYGESEDIDFINNEIELYKIYLKTVNLPIDSAFSRFWIIELNSNLKTFGISKGDYDVIFNNENGYYYYKIYNDIVEPAAHPKGAIIDVEKKIMQTRFIFPKIISFLETKKSELEAPQQNETVKTKKSKKTLLEFIHNVEDKEGFILGLKNAFPTEIGKDIRVIIDTLKEQGILIIGAREFKNFVEVLAVYFGRNIGEYQGIQNEMTITTETSDPINKKLNPLITKHKTI